VSNASDSTSISVSAPHFTENLFAILTETFENTRGVYLDKDADLLSTLAGLSAKQASREVLGTTIAAQVFHTLFYVRALARYAEGFTGKTDWNESWTTKSVTEPEWDALKAQLREDYERVTGRLRAVTHWGEDPLDLGMAVAVHSAYHLGAIRQLVKAVGGA
jgi:hypothetical protein